MKIRNELPLFLDCLRRWDRLPSEKEFERRYLKPMLPLLGPMLEDFSGFRGATLYEFCRSLNWEVYRGHSLLLDPAWEESRVRRHLDGVERLLGVRLEGEVVLFGAFTLMDGYARFDRGTHRVYLGVDEEHGRGQYLDILVSHELAHVARESQASVWEGLGLDPKMTHDEFVASMPVIEHLLSEGYSCVVSELLNPGNPPWAFVYQDEDSYGRVMEYSVSVDAAVHAELRDPRGHYRNLYQVDNVVPVPRYAHYVWAWKWTKHVLEKFAGNDPRRLLGMCAKDLVEDALAFDLKA